MYTKIVRELSYSYPFVYRIGEQYYYVGMTVFRKCTQEEIDEYKRYSKEMEKYADVDKYNIPETVGELAESLAKLMNLENSEYDDRNAGRARRELETLLEQQSKAVLAEIVEQREKFVQAIELRDRYQIKYGQP